MKFGVITAPEHAPLLAEQGWDYLEVNIQATFEGLKPDAEWSGDRWRSLALPCASGAMLVPGSLKITGPAVDMAGLKQYIERTFARAASVGCSTLVFGSGGARQVPEGFDRDVARGQILEFLRMLAPLAQTQGVTVVVEALNRRECNIVNTLTESMELVRDLNHPNVKQLYDSYHAWLENEPLSALRDAGRSVRHVHLADKEGRVAPGLSGLSDYRAAFRILKEYNYDGRITVEASNFDIARDGASVLAYLKDQWAKA